MEIFHEYQNQGNCSQCFCFLNYLCLFDYGVGERTCPADAGFKDEQLK